MNGKGYYKYAEDVVSGRVVAGKFVKQACQRFLDFMDNSDYEFREESVDRVISLFYHLRHSKGRHSGSRFTSSMVWTILPSNIRRWKMRSWKITGSLRRDINTPSERWLKISCRYSRRKAAAKSIN